MEELKHKVGKGVIWSVIDRGLGSGITFLVGIVLARILTPREYGILAMISIFIAVSHSIVDSGFSNALIRKVKVKRIDYNTIFFFNVFISIVLYSLLFFTAPYISHFFRQPVLAPVTRIIGVVLIINALAIIPRTILIREVDFKTQTKISISASVMSGIVGIFMAYKGYGVYSLVGQQISSQLLNTTLLWVFSQWRPAIEFSKESFKELFGFGSKLLVSGIIATIYNNLSSLVIGKFYPAKTLGYYGRANQFQNIFADSLSSAVDRVSFPALSSVQEDQNKLQNGIRKVIKCSMLLSCMGLLGMIAVAKPLILVLVGEKWLPSVPFLQIICIGGIVSPLHVVNLRILQIKGRSDLFLKLEIIKKIIYAFPIALCIIFHEIYALILGSAIISLLCCYINGFYSKRFASYSMTEQIKDILPSFFIALIIASLMWCINLLKVCAWEQLILQILLGLFLFYFIYEKLKWNEYLEMKNILMKFIRTMK